MMHADGCSATLPDSGLALMSTRSKESNDRLKGLITARTTETAGKWAEQDQVRKQVHAVRREQILREAARCFNRKGYHGTTIEDIARHLNVSTAALYYYFNSKEELLFHCHQASLEAGMEGLRTAEQLGGPPDDRLQKALKHYIEHVTDLLEGCVAVLEEGALSPKHHREVVRRRDEYEQGIRRLLEEGIASKVFVDCNPKVIGFAILGAMNWISKWYRSDGDLQPKDIAQILSNYLVSGLRRGIESHSAMS
jgi:TetR/AcrR family transcriptional regulator